MSVNPEQLDEALPAVNVIPGPFNLEPQLEVNEASSETEPKIASFKTARGSIYKYDGEGRTRRFKTSTGEQHGVQDLTVFLPLENEAEGDFIDALYAVNADDSKPKPKVYVMEREADDSVRIVRKTSDIKNPDRIYLGIVEDGRVKRANQVSLAPVVGYSVFDTRHYEEDGQWYTDRHLGNKVTGITYAE